MSDMPTDEMKQAAMNAWCDEEHDGPKGANCSESHTCWGKSDEEALTVALAAAVAVMPTADGWMWCEQRIKPSGWCAVTCPGPHRTLILGPEVES